MIRSGANASKKHFAGQKFAPGFMPSRSRQRVQHPDLSRAQHAVRQSEMRARRLAGELRAHRAVEPAVDVVNFYRAGSAPRAVASEAPFVNPFRVWVEPDGKMAKEWRAIYLS